MPYKICQVIFSTNRIDYLSRTLKSQQNLNFEQCEVTKVFFDDFPTGRNNTLISALARSYGFNHIILHEKNQGITRTWQELFNFVNDHEFDYVWHQEDDVEILHPIRIIDLINILNDNKHLSQIQLKRNNWYDSEITPIGPKDTDTIIGKYRIEHGNPYFWMMSSLYPAWICREPILSVTGNNPSESVIANYLLTKFGIRVGLLKTEAGGIMVNHFGEYTRGIRVAENEPGWEQFKNFNPMLDYHSKTGQERS